MSDAVVRPAASRPKLSSLVPQLAWAFVFFMTTRPFAFQLKGIDPGGAQDQASKTPWDEYLHYAILIGIIAYAIRRGALKTVFNTLFSAPFILAFTVLALASAVWSIEPYLTVREAGRYAGVVFYLAAMITLQSKRDSARSMLYGAALCIGFSVIWAIVFPHYGRHDANDIYQASHVGKWRGVYQHKNIFGQITGITVGAFISVRQKLVPNWLKYGAIVTGLICLAFAQSASGLLIAAIGGGFGYALFRLQGYPRIIAVSVIGCFCLLLSDAGSEMLSSVLMAMGKNPTFSGRTFLWEAATQLISERWLLGFGLYSVHDPSITAVFEKGAGETHDAHNSYLELTIALGMVGLALFLLSVIDSAIRGWAARLSGQTSAARQVMTLIIVMWLFGALAESSPFLPDGPVNAFGLFAILWLYAPTSGRRSAPVEKSKDPQLTVKGQKQQGRGYRPLVEID